MKLSFAIIVLMFSLQSFVLADDGFYEFDGKSLDGWVTSSGKPVIQGWEIADGMIHLKPEGPRGGNIYAVHDYSDFEMEFEWKTTKQGNNGVKYRVRKYGNRELGIEYQILDDVGYPAKLKDNQLTAGIYGLYAPSATKLLKPVGEFNHSRIVVCGNNIEHWLNGSLVASADVGSCDWLARKADSKFNDIEGFAENRVGKIMLTDHRSETWFRRISIRPLSSTESQVADRYSPRGGLLRSLFSRFGSRH